MLLYIGIMPKSKENKKEIVNWYVKKLDEEEYQKEKSKAEKMFDEIITHPVIKKASKDHFMAGQYRIAVLDAMIQLEEMIKQKAKFPKDNQDRELSGYNLMFKVFDPNNPILRWSKLERQSEKDELAGYRYIMAGAVLGIRDPKAHTIFKQRPLRALQLLTLVTLLADLIEISEYVERKK